MPRFAVKHFHYFSKRGSGNKLETGSCHHVHLMDFFWVILSDSVLYACHACHQTLSSLGFEFFGFLLPISKDLRLETAIPFFFWSLPQAFVRLLFATWNSRQALSWEPMRTMFRDDFLLVLIEMYWPRNPAHSVHANLCRKVVLFLGRASQSGELTSEDRIWTNWCGVCGNCNCWPRSRHAYGTL